MVTNCDMEALEKILNVPASPEIFEVEKGHIKRFADAIGDPNPLFRDMEYAKKTRFGTIVGPPFFLIDAGLVKFVENILQYNKSGANINGGSEIEYFEPMKVGDTITTVAKLVDIKEKSGKSGNLLILTIEVTYTNQNDFLVAVLRNVFIWR